MRHIDYILASVIYLCFPIHTDTSRSHLASYLLVSEISLTFSFPSLALPDPNLNPSETHSLSGLVIPHPFPCTLPHFLTFSFPFPFLPTPINRCFSLPCLLACFPNFLFKTAFSDFFTLLFLNSYFRSCFVHSVKE